MQETEIIREFLVESSENLCRLDREMVELEQRPKDAKLLASIFRTLHTIKGTCGFLAFGTLETITHHAENILGQVRGEQRELTPQLVSIILEMVDAVKAELTSIEETGKESGAQYADLVARQKTIAANVQTSLAPAASPEESIAVMSSPPPLSEEPAISPEPQAVAVPTRVDSTPIASPSGPAATSNDYGRRRTDTPLGSAAESTIRVDVALLNKLMNLVGELVLARNQILQFNAKYEDATLNTTAQKLNLITTELQEGVMRTRMQPIGIIWGNLPRVVRDLATSQGKQIELQMDGSETELDKTIIEAIKDPLTHIVRNACDHGIETPELRGRAQKHAQGKLTLSAFHEGGNVNIEICDDGAGVYPQHIKETAIDKGLIKPEKAARMSDRELVNLVFLPGFSTAKQISNISGRGVGMDVVKTNIERIGGTVDIASRPGHGTTVKIKIPLTLAIVPGLVVSSASERFVIPQASLLELVWLEGEKAKTQIEPIKGTPVYRRRDHLPPLVRLNEVLKLGSHADCVSDAVNIVIVEAEERQFGLIASPVPPSRRKSRCRENSTRPPRSR